MRWKGIVCTIIGTAVMVGVSACQQAGTNPGDQKTADFKKTAENKVPEMKMDNQPQSSYWFPEQLLKWKADKDPDLKYNISQVPLAKRADRDELQAVNKTQNKDTNIMSISIMNSSTSGNAPRGTNTADVNTFSYWQYVDTLVYWGGSSGEGLIVPPSPDVVDEGHKNGVKVIGTIFFPQNTSGGKMEWLDTFLKQDASGNFPMTDKLIEVAKTYGFDGWFLNQETEGTASDPLTPEKAELLEAFIQEMKEKAPELELVYYDSMTTDGKVDWQNALTDKNLPFLKGTKGKPGADSMFLNFWWTEDALAKKELLKSSALKAAENKIDPYSLYAGVDIQSDGYLTPIRWDLFESSPNSTYTSLGLYCPSWAYSSSKDMQDFWNKENALWVNTKGDPSADMETSSDTMWKGISHYAVERTAITSLPFTTNFSTGNGYSFFKNGEQISKLDWNNRSIADILPTYRYIIKNEGDNQLKADIDVGNAYYGGNSLGLKGHMRKNKKSVIKLYSADVPVKKGDITFTTTAKTDGSAQLSAIIGLEDGTEKRLEGDKKVGKDWTAVAFDTSSLKGHKIRSISYEIQSDKDDDSFEFYFGNISITNKDKEDLPTVSGVKVENKTFDEDGAYAGVRLTWKSDKASPYYEIYKVNEDQTKSLLGVTNTTNFFVNSLPRTDKTNKTVFEVVPVTQLLKDGTSAQASMKWPDISKPRADFKADETLVAPGEKVTFSSLCSKNTTQVSWEFPGAETEHAKGKSATAVYDKEGTYDVTVTAKNKSGTDEKKVKGCIVVTKAASDGVKLLSQGATVKATSFTNDNEAPPFAVDGDKKKKWCATGTPPHELTIDLGAVKTISAVDIYHAEAGGEDASMNTKAYTILVSKDGSDYKEVAKVTKNTAGHTHDTFAPVEARYVKLSVNKPTQGSDTAARIYEVEVYGLDK